MKAMVKRSQVLLEYLLAVALALLIASYVFSAVLNVAVQGGELVKNETKKVIEELHSGG